MEFDELWHLHEELTKILSDRIITEKRELENRLAKLSRIEMMAERGSLTPPPVDRAPRRKYPKVLPKYYNPLAPSETWSGRGKRPRWLVAALQTGGDLAEFKIDDPEKETLEMTPARGEYNGK